MAIHIPPAIAKIAPDGNLTPRQKRHFMIDMVMRKGKPGTGSSHEFMRRRTAEIRWPDLRKILKSVKWAIVGVVATRAYMPERMTQAMDIMVHESSGEIVIKLLEQAGYRVSSGLTISGYLMLSPDETKVNVIFGNYPWLKKALKNTGQDPAGYPAVRLPYLTVMKLQAERSQDWTDVSCMLGWADVADLDEVRTVVKEYAPEDMEDLEALIFIGKREKEFPPNTP